MPNEQSLTKKLLIYGSKDFGLLVRDLAEGLGYTFAGFIDDVYEGMEVIGDFVSVSAQYHPDEYEIVIGIGYNNLPARWSIYQNVISHGYTVPKLIHPRAYVRDKDNIGNGCIIMANAIVDWNAKLDDLVVVWPNALVNHDSLIKHNTFLSPASTVCGFVIVEENNFIGAGSTIVDHTFVPKDSFVKAGTLYKLNRTIKNR